MVAPPPSLVAQTAPWARVSATVVGGITRIDLTPQREPITEGWVEQPVVMAAAAWGPVLRGQFTLNFEGLSMPDGVLTPGAFGEGWFDKRHPHTYIHEFIVTARAGGRRWDASLTAGKGFVAFGTEDPMNRPPLRFPVNHHYSQILERVVVIAGVRAGPVILEGSLFNGDEPERPGQLPKIDRLGDSWAARLTAHPVTGVETQVSYASVKSPEHRPGNGPTQGKWSASVRVDRAVGAGRGYALVEWARTSDAFGFFVYHSVLGEIQLRMAAHRPYYRFERTERPEEERLLDLFRAVRPHLDDNILGITRWTVHTVGYGFALAPEAPIRAEPFVELAFAVATNVGGGLLQPLTFYGDDTLFGFSVGVRLRAGPAHRMGRYGVLAGHAAHSN